MKIVEMFKGVIDKLEPMDGLFPSTFSRVDPEKLKTKLKLKDEAESRGKNNLPSEIADSWDDVELGIIAVIENERDKAAAIYHDNYRSYENRINGMKGLGFKGVFQAITNAAEANLAMLFHQKKNDLDNAKSEVLKSENDLNKFKENNARDSSASYPKNRFLCIAIALFLVVFETAVSGHFFAQGNEYGMIGGYAYALAPALLNVGIGFFLGEFGLRLSINRNSFKKISGIFLCILLSLALLFLNLLVTHYRSAFATMVDNANTIALESFFKAPFSLNDVESWLLFFFGMFFAIIATIDFWKMDDPYAGYGKIDRNHKVRIDDYEETRSDFLKELEEKRDEKLHELEVELLNITNRCGEMQAILDSQQRLKTLYLSHLDHLESSGNVLLKTYRNLNSSFRSNNPPRYFDKQWKITKAIPVDSKVNFDAILQAFQVDSDGAKTVYSECVEKINKKYSETFVSC